MTSATRIGTYFQAAKAARGRLGCLAVAAFVLLTASPAARALDLSDGPVDTLPFGSNCSTSGDLGRGSGLTITCTITSPENYADVYFGLANDSGANGNEMDGSGPTSYEIFRYAGSTSDSITYTSSTTLDNKLGSSTEDVNTRVVLTLTSGSGDVIDTGGTPADNADGDIGKLFRVTGSSFSIHVDVQSNRASTPVFDTSSPNVYDPTHTPSDVRNTTRLYFGFYYLGCGA